MLLDVALWAGRHPFSRTMTEIKYLSDRLIFCEVDVSAVIEISHYLGHSVEHVHVDVQVGLSCELVMQREVSNCLSDPFRHDDLAF